MKTPLITNGQYGWAAEQNSLIEDARSASWLMPHQMSGIISLPTNPSNNQTLTVTVNGSPIVFTFVTTLGSTAGSVLIGSSVAVTLQNLYNMLANPQSTTANQIALSLGNIQIISYLTFAITGTSLVVSSLNDTYYSPVTSVSVSTTVTSGTYTANSMALFVEKGQYFIGGTRIAFAGGYSPTITAPVTYPRIDLLTINSSGTLALVTGTENASPSVPTYPKGVIVLCEIYNVVGETSINDNSNIVSGQGYIQYDVRSYLNNGNYVDQFASSIFVGTDTGVANAPAIALNPAISGYKDGMIVAFRVAYTNTGNTTLAVNGLTAYPLKKAAGTTQLAAGDIVAGQLILAELDLTLNVWQFQSQVGTPAVPSQITNLFTVASGKSATVGGIAQFFNGYVFNPTPLTAGSTSAFITDTVTAAQAVALDSSHIAVAYYDSVQAKTYAIIGYFNAGSFTWGTPVAMTTTTSGPVAINSFSSTSFILVYAGVKGTVCTVSGTNNLTINPGTEANIVTATPAASTLNLQTLRVVCPSSTSFVVGIGEGGSSSSPVIAVGGNISGTTITVGSYVTLNSNSSNTGNTGIEMQVLSSSIIATADYTSSSTVNYGQLYLNGTTLTYTQAGSSATASPSGYSPRIAVLSSTQFIVGWINYSTSYAQVVACQSTGNTSISGGSLTPLTAVSCGNPLDVVPLGTTGNFVAFFNSNNTQLRARAGNISSGTTIVLGTETTLDSTNVSSSTTSIRACNIDSTDAIAFYPSTSNQIAAQVQVSSMLNTIATGTITAFSSSNSPYFTASLGGIAITNNGNGTVVPITSGILGVNVGVFAASASSGASVNVIIGGIANVYSGLTIDQTYYFTSTGTVTTTSSGNQRLGRSISTTAIQINTQGGSATTFF